MSAEQVQSVAMQQQREHRSLVMLREKMFSTFTKSTTVITIGINQIYSRQTQGIIISVQQ